MKKDRLDAVGYLDGRLIEKAEACTGGKKKNSWVRWGALAACLALAAALVIGGLRSGLLGIGNETVTLENGEALTFRKENALTSADIDLSGLETKALSLRIAELPLTANAYVDAGTHRVVGLEGELGNGKLVVSMDGRCPSDTVVEGRERISTVKGTEVNAGYFVTKPNSRGERTVIYYADLALGENGIHMEFAGDERERETVKKELADSLLKLIDSGETELSRIRLSAEQDSAPHAEPADPPQPEGGEEQTTASSSADYPAAIMAEGRIYLLSGEVIAAAIGENDVIGRTTSYTDAFPEKNGECNFSLELGMPYARVDGGIAVYYENAWRLCTPKES